MLRIAAAAVALMVLFALTWQVGGRHKHRFFGPDIQKVDR